MKTFSFLLLPTLYWPMMVQGAPRPDLAASAASEQAKAVGFLDGVVASYRKLYSLSVEWHAKAHLGQGAQTGVFLWRHTKPALVRFENRTMGYRMISDGRRAFWSGGESYPDCVLRWRGEL